MLTALRILCGALLVVRPALWIFVVGVVSDWLDGPIARRAPASPYGARLDLEADSLLGPIARYLIAPARARDQMRWDRLTGVAQMVLLGAIIARLPARWASVPVTAARCAALAARMVPRGRLDLTAQPAEPR